MYRGRLWTMRQFAGFGSARETNERFRYLLTHGQTGLSTAFDMPTLMGYDADHPRARGEVGREGVAVSTLDDARQLFAGIDLGVVTTSMTVNCTASVLLAMYLAVAEEQGVPWDRLGGTIQNDMLKEFIAEGVDLSAGTVDAHRGRHDPVLRRARAALASGLDQRLPHPRGRLHGGAGARLHARGRARVRAGVHRARAGDRRVRAAPVVLLQPAQRLPRGDREAACGAPAVGHVHARSASARAIAPRTPAATAGAR
jgi:hypothetical protein